MSSLWQPLTFKEMFSDMKIHNVLVCSLVHGTLANTRIENTRTKKTYSEPRIQKNENRIDIAIM